MSEILTMGDGKSSRPDERLELLGASATKFETAVLRFLAEAGQPRFRLTQLQEWIYKRAPASFDDITVLPRRLRGLLAERFVLHPLVPLLERLSEDGTRKYLWRTGAGKTIESVLIPDGDRITYCISTQAGCPVKCTFCATGYGGFEGQLSAAEIVDQVALMRLQSGEAPTNVVFMGMGEPLLNFEAVREALGVLTSGEQVGLGSRRITVSTVGVPERIGELADAFPQVKLAVSLHAVRDDLRDELIPLNTRYPLGEVLEAVTAHHETTGRKVTFEYIVIPGVNDSARDARGLAGVAGKVPSRINLIGYNPFPGGPYRKPELEQLLRFRQEIAAGFAGDVTIRRSRGEDIQGACGQLRLHSAASREGGRPAETRAPTQ